MSHLDLNKMTLEQIHLGKSNVGDFYITDFKCTKQDKDALKELESIRDFIIKDGGYAKEIDIAYHMDGTIKDGWVRLYWK
jgi:hypothetical protein